MVKKESSNTLMGDLEYDSSKVDFPISVQMELTRRCNLACKHCYIPGHDRVTKEVTKEQWFKIIDELEEYGVLKLGFTGGELFLRKDAMEIIRYAKDKGFIITLNTNLTFMNDQEMDTLAELNLNHLFVSIYGYKESYDAFVERKGAYEKFIYNVKYLRNKGVPIRLKFMPTKYNYKDLSTVWNLADELGCDFSIDYKLSSRTDGDKDPHKMGLTKAQLSHFILSEKLLPDILKKREWYEKQLEKHECDDFMCNAGKSYAFINADGIMQPCVAIPIRRANNSVIDSGFKYVWEQSKLMKAVRNIQFEDLTKCSSCSDVKYCSRCIGSFYLGSGSLLTADADSCESTKAIKEIVEENEAKGNLTPITKEMLVENAL